MKSIPKKLLIHTVSVKQGPSEDRWGNANGDGDSEIIINYVRIEPTSKVVRDKNNAELQLSATLFFDMKNSKSSIEDFKFNVDDILTFNTQNFSVKTIDALYDENDLHHYELGLVKHV